MKPSTISWTSRACWPKPKNFAIKERVAEQIGDAMAQEGVTKTALATRMQTSRRQLGRLLDPSNPSVTLATLRWGA